MENDECERHGRVGNCLIQHSAFSIQHLEAYELHRMLRKPR